MKVAAKAYLFVDNWPSPPSDDEDEEEEYGCDNNLFHNSKEADKIRAALLRRESQR